MNERNLKKVKKKRLFDCDEKSVKQMIYLNQRFNDE